MENSPYADHGEHQVADVVAQEGQKAQERAQCSANMGTPTDRAQLPVHVTGASGVPRSSLPPAAAIRPGTLRSTS